MTIRSLKIFVTIVECGNMSKAASKLYVTQSSVSQTIADIEKEYNIILFDRLKNGLSLTATGEEMLVYAKNILNLLNELENVLKHESRNPKIRIGASATIGATVMRHIVDDLCAEITDLDYSVFVGNTRNIESMLLSNELDIGMVEGEPQSKDLKSEMVMEDKLVLICSPAHRFYGKKSVSMNDLIKEPLILREEGSGTRRQLMEQLEEFNANPEIKWSCNSPDVVKSAVKENLGVSVISARLVREDVESGTLWACDIADARLARTFKLLYHKDKFFTKTMKTFVRISYDHSR